MRTFVSVALLTLAIACDDSSRQLTEADALGTDTAQGDGMAFPDFGEGDDVTEDSRVDAEPDTPPPDLGTDSSCPELVECTGDCRFVHHEVGCPECVCSDPVPGASALLGDWLGGMAMGGCIDEAAWLSFEESGLFTFGFINSNACMLEEGRGVDRCVGAFSYPNSSTVHFQCEGQDPSIAGNIMELDATFALIPGLPEGALEERLSLMAFHST